MKTILKGIKKTLSLKTIESEGRKESALSGRLNLEFKQWFVGLVDGEGSFIIEENKKEKTINLCLSIGFHPLELHLLEEIQRTLGCGRVYLDKRHSRIMIRRYSEIVERIIPIFEETSLNTSKRYDYMDFNYVAEMIKRKEHLTEEGYERIIKIKSGMNSKRKEFSNNYEIKITWPWLLGFIEGEGCFTLDRIKPRLFIDLTSKEKRVLDTIRDFLDCGSVIVRNQIKTNLNQKPSASYSVNMLPDLKDKLIFNLDKLKFRSKKGLDYKIWREIVIKSYIGWNIDEEFKRLILDIKPTLNTNKITIEEKIEKTNQWLAEISKYDNLSSPYQIIEGIRYIKETNKKLPVLTKITVHNSARADGGIVTYRSINKASKELNISYDIIKKILDTGKEYKGYIFKTK